jgi:hypothetical protein
VCGASHKPRSCNGSSPRWSRRSALQNGRQTATWVQAMVADGLITIKSSYGPKGTMNKLEAAVKAKGMTVFARIDRACTPVISHGRHL